MMEYEQDDMNRDEAEDPEVSPSEIVETHVLPDEATAEDLNVQMKRPRRRRRRRRRKRPKPTPTPEDLESYYSVPEDETKRKPIKYRLPDNNEEIPPDIKNLPRRRNQKRRRRPLKRPVVEDYVIIEDPSEFINNTEEHQLDYSNNDQPEAGEHNHKIPESDENDVPLPTIVAENDQPKDVTISLTRKPVKDNEVHRVVHEEQPKSHHKTAENEFSVIATFDEHPKHESPIVQEEGYKFSNRNKEPESVKTISDEHKSKHHNRETEIPRLPIQNRRKRPPSKTENAPPDTTKPDSEPAKSETSHVEIRNHHQNARKQETRNQETHDAHKHNTTENVKTKNESIFKPTDHGKKELFKIRRLPPTSAILRHMKTRPSKNTTGPTKFEAATETSDKTDESLSNDILHTTEGSTSKPENEELPPANKTENEKSELPVRIETTEKSSDSEEKFEFPILKYTGQKQSAKPTSTSTTTTSTTAASTTENTAFIYISCNHTINEVLKNTFNFTGDNITLAATKYLSLIQNHTNNEPVTEKTVTVPLNRSVDDTMDVLKSVAMEELEKLLQQVRTETSVSNSTEMRNASETKNQTHTVLPFEHLDSGESESQLDYHIQNNVVAKTSKFPLVNEPPAVRVSTEHYFREAKWFQDLPKYKSESRDERKYENPFAKSSASSNKELILTYTSTDNPNLFYNEIDQEENVFREKEMSLHLRNTNSSYRKMFNENATHRMKSHTERKKLPLAVKSAIIISGAILALAVLGFFALLLSCKIRQAKSRMKCQRELYREQFQNSEFRQSSRSTSPVVSKSNYNGRSFNNNIQSNVASNRNYYLWQTLRKTFQYD